MFPSAVVRGEPGERPLPVVLPASVAPGRRGAPCGRSADWLGRSSSAVQLRLRPRDVDRLVRLEQRLAVAPARDGRRTRPGTRACPATPGTAAGPGAPPRSSPSSWPGPGSSGGRRRSAPKKAKPMGASRSRVASRAESDTSIPDTRGWGTEVSVLIAALQSRCVKSRWAMQRLLPAHCGHKQASGNAATSERTSTVPRQLGTAPSRYREHPQWPRRRASHILGDIAPRRGHHADLVAFRERSGGLPAAATGTP